jgi:hypothetical protein
MGLCPCYRGLASNVTESISRGQQNMAKMKLFIERRWMVAVEVLNYYLKLHIRKYRGQQFMSSKT